MFIVSNQTNTNDLFFQKNNADIPYRLEHEKMQAASDGDIEEPIIEIPVVKRIRVRFSKINIKPLEFF